MFVSGVFDRPAAEPNEAQVDTPAQRALALEAATQSIVLLKNAGHLLPLDAAKLHSIAVIGPNAGVAVTGGGGSSHVRPKYAVSSLDGIRDRAGTVSVQYAEDAAAAAHADVAIVVVGLGPKLESEDSDRKTLELPLEQEELIRSVAKANKNTIVVVNAGSPVAMNWLDEVPAVLDMWYGGQEGGHALAAVLFGDANPSGKLPMTFPKRWEDSSAYGHYPGENLHVTYAEGIYVGYRSFDRHKMEPLFPFGHGLSYTTFDYSDLEIAPGLPAEVKLRVRNVGPRAGAEVVQLYVHQVRSSADRPPKELKGFRRVVLAPGETETVSFTLDRAALSFYSTAKKDWVAEPGAFEVLVGSSSRDIRLKGSFELAK